MILKPIACTNIFKMYCVVPVSEVVSGQPKLTTSSEWCATLLKVNVGQAVVGRPESHTKSGQNSCRCSCVKDVTSDLLNMSHHSRIHDKSSSQIIYQSLNQSDFVTSMCVNVHPSQQVPNSTIMFQRLTKNR